jgi:hypothetical protein
MSSSRGAIVKAAIACYQICPSLFFRGKSYPSTEWELFGARQNGNYLAEELLIFLQPEALYYTKYIERDTPFFFDVAISFSTFSVVSTVQVSGSIASSCLEVMRQHIFS